MLSRGFHENIACGTADSGFMLLFFPSDTFKGLKGEGRKLPSPFRPYHLLCRKSCPDTRMFSLPVRRGKQRMKACAAGLPEQNGCFVINHCTNSW